jgi:uncharacterized protein (UPF0261 family)
MVLCDIRGFAGYFSGLFRSESTRHCKGYEGLRVGLIPEISLLTIREYSRFFPISALRKTAPMPKKVIIVGTLDTKGEEHLFLKQKIEENGIKTLVMDTGIVGPPFFEPDISRHDICSAVGYTIDELIKKKDRKFGIDVMAMGASKVARHLYEEGHLGGIISIGGSQGTYISSTVMRDLPFGVPKVLVSTTVSGDMSDYVGHKDITLMHSITDILGLNSFSRRFLSQAGSAICGMMKEDIFEGEKEKPLISITMVGLTTPCVMKIKKLFESKKRMYDLIVFHARGSGGRAMEELIRDGVIKGVLDVTTKELADELVGGIRSAGPHRLEAAGEMGIPQVIGPGGMDMVNFGPMESVPGKFTERKFYVHTPMVTVMRTTVEENKRLGNIIAEKLNRAKGKAIIVLPMKGFSALDNPGAPFGNLQCSKAFAQSLKKHIKDSIKVVELDCHINEDPYAEEVVNQFVQILS